MSRLKLHVTIIVTGKASSSGISAPVSWSHGGAGGQGGQYKIVLVSNAQT